ncbi:hypothetical protein NOVO_02515 [Rickettsiales bacterium Ac37b]|nr:hypothetical protein NOVO_02515 [Rickettsiales bacterium Ac37b]
MLNNNLNNTNFLYLHTPKQPGYFSEIDLNEHENSYQPQVLLVNLTLPYIQNSSYNNDYT